MSSTPQARWARISQLLDEALDLPIDERGAFLDKLGHHESALRGELEELISACEREGFLDKPVARRDAVVASLAESLTAAGALAPGTRIGPFRIVQEVGRGGMGAVYEAERADEQFRQRVALKTLRHVLSADPQFVRRFLDERQLLASLEHPNIARLVDGGVTPEGMSWFAMEFVEGRPIDRYCDEQCLTIDARLALFAGVCDAVQYAHRQLIVHRDLKPSNILVSADGTVKLLDFGIARFLAAEESEAPDDGARLLTPQYASPEQISGGRITTASDVYALGAILYELLSGQRPYRLSGSGVTEMNRVLREEDVPAPSTAVTQRAGASASDSAAARSTSVERLSRRLTGDLDAIVLMAMRRDPLERYSSAEGLSADIRRSLNHQVVSARANNFPYRASRFVRRNRIGVGAAVALVLALIGGMGATAWQARVASREAAKAREVTNFITGLFQVSDPNESRGRDITARELLEAGTTRVDSALAGQPEVQAEMLRVLGTIHRELGLYSRADTILRRGLDRATTAYGGDHPEVARVLTDLGTVQSALGAYVSADTILRRALDMRRRELGGSHPDVGITIGALARNELSRVSAASAESLFREALRIDRRAYGDDHLAVATALHDLGNALWLSGKHHAADSAHREGLAIRQRHLDRDHPLVTQSNAMLADVLGAKAEFAEAERLQRDVVERRRRLHPNGHPDVAIALYALAFTFELSGQFAQAAQTYQEALEVRQKHLGPEHPETISTINNLAVVRYRMGDLSGAESAFRDVVRLWSKTLGSEHLSTVTALNNLGATLSEAGRFNEAESFLRRSLTARRERLGADNIDVAASLRNVGLLLYRSGKNPVEAERNFREALRIYREKMPLRHPRIAEALTGLGALLVQRGRAAEAEPLLREAFDIRKERLHDTDWRIAETQRPLGVALAGLGRHDEAEKMLLESYRRFQESGRSARETEETLASIVAFYEARGSRAEAARFRRLLRKE